MNLPFYLSVRFETKNDTVFAVVCSTIHVNREIRCPIQWSAEFFRVKRSEVDSDVMGFIIRRYDLKWEEGRYV